MPSGDSGEGVNDNASTFMTQNQSHPPSVSGIMNMNGAGNLSSLANMQSMMSNGSMNNNATGKNLPPQGQQAFVQPNYSDQQMQAAYAVAAMAEKSLGAKNPQERQLGVDNPIEDKKGTNLMNGSLKGSVNHNFSNNNISTGNMDMNPSASSAINPTSMMMMAASNNGRTPSSIASNMLPPASNGSAGNPYLSSQQSQAGFPTGLGAGMGGFSAATASTLAAKGAAIGNDTSIPSSISGMSILPLTKKKKIKGKPKRPLSAYNLFFKHERKRILASLEEEKEREAALIEAEAQNTVKKEDAGGNEKNEDEKGDDDANKKVEEETKKEKGEISEGSDKKEAEEKSQEGDKEMKKEGTKEGETKKQTEEETREGDKEEEGKEEEKSKKQRHGKIGFETLAKTIGQRWSQLEEPDLKKYKDMANEDMKRYKREMEIFLTKKQEADAEESAHKAAAKKAAEEKAMVNQQHESSYENQYQMLLQQQQNRNQMNQLGWKPTAQLQGSGDMNNNLLMQALLLQQQQQQQQQQLQLMRQQQHFAQQQSQYGRPEQQSFKKPKLDNLNSFGDQQYMFQQSQPSSGAASDLNMGALYGNTNQPLNRSNMFSNNFNAFNNMANTGGVNTMGLMNTNLNNMSGFSGMNNGMMGSANFMQSHSQQFQNGQQSMPQDGNAQSREYQNVYNSGKTSPAMYNMRS